MINVNQIDLRDEDTKNEGCCVICFDICKSFQSKDWNFIKYTCEKCKFNSYYLFNHSLFLQSLILDDIFTIRYSIYHYDGLYIFSKNEGTIYEFYEGAKLSKETVEEAKRVLKLKLFF
jgi:hypothetical protein